MKFSGGSSEPSTQSTWSPPTVKTKKRQFNYIDTSKADVNGYHKPKHDNWILQTACTSTVGLLLITPSFYDASAVDSVKSCDTCSQFQYIQT